MPPGNGDTYNLTKGYYALASTLYPLGAFTMIGTGIGLASPGTGGGSQIYSQDNFPINMSTHSGNGLLTLENLGILTQPNLQKVPVILGGSSINATDVYLQGDIDIFWYNHESSGITITLTNCVLQSSYDFFNTAGETVVMSGCTLIGIGGSTGGTNIGSTDSPEIRGLAINSGSATLTNCTLLVYGVGNVKVYGVLATEGATVSLTDSTVSIQTLGPGTPTIFRSLDSESDSVITLTNCQWDASKNYTTTGGTIVGTPISRTQRRCSRDDGGISMIFKNTAGQGIYLYAYTSSGPQIGDAANITGAVSKDLGAAAAFATTHPSEINSTIMKGIYGQPFSKTETNANAMACAWSSTTSGVTIAPITILTTGMIQINAAGQLVVATDSGYIATGSGSECLFTFLPPLTGVVVSLIQLQSQNGVPVGLWLQQDGSWGAYATAYPVVATSTPSPLWSASLPAGSPAATYLFVGYNCAIPGGYSGPGNLTNLFQLVTVITESPSYCGNGAYQVTVTVTDDYESPVEGAFVRLTSGATTYVGVTNGYGQVLFGLNAATYSVIITAYGYCSLFTSLAVTGGTTVEYQLNVLTPLPYLPNQLCLLGDIQEIFGIPNVVKWAILSGTDPNSAPGLAEFTSRINWAINLSSAEFRNAMRQGGYQLPLDGPDALVWQTNIAAIKAGLYLYMHLRPTQRGEDGRPLPDRYDGLFTYAEQQLNFVRARKIKLDGSPFGRGTNGPSVTHERSHDFRGPGQLGYGPDQLPFNYPFGG